MDKIVLTKTDKLAIKKNDSNYIKSKGADYYSKGDYTKAVEYYHLAASMGDINAVSNLGYCYLYGRSIEPNLELAISYLEIAASRGSVDAAYKLGDIYGGDKWSVADKEMSIYYYRMAASYIIEGDWEDDESILYNDELTRYPSLCFALGREKMPNGDMNTDLDLSYQFLKQAERGYKIELANGNSFYEKAYNSVIECLNDKIFNEIKEKYENCEDEDYTLL